MYMCVCLFVFVFVCVCVSVCVYSGRNLKIISYVPDPQVAQIWALEWEGYSLLLISITINSCHYVSLFTFTFSGPWNGQAGDISYMYVCMYIHVTSSHAVYYVLAAVFASWFCVLITSCFMNEDIFIITSSPLCLLRVFTSYLKFGSYVCMYVCVYVCIRIESKI
jgi:hypothetical protein